jgi:hypothetical protein
MFLIIYLCVEIPERLTRRCSLFLLQSMVASFEMLSLSEIFMELIHMYNYTRLFHYNFPSP